MDWVTGLAWKVLSAGNRRLTFNELNRALAELNRQAADTAEAWRLPTYIELAMFGTSELALVDFGRKEIRRVPVWLADLDSAQPPGKDRLCRGTNGGWIENAQETHQGSCAALLVRAVPPQQDR